MKDLVWDKTLSVEVNEIDDDHRKLVDLFNILNHAVTEKSASDYIDAVLEELISFTIWHFRHEERLMVKYRYPHMEEHKAEHQQLIESASTLQKKFQQQGKAITEADIKFLEHWLVGHILGTDMDLGIFLGKAI